MNLVTQYNEHGETMSKFCWLAAAVNFLIIKKGLHKNLVLNQMRNAITSSNFDFKENFLKYIKDGISMSDNNFKTDFITLLNKTFGLKITLFEPNEKFNKMVLKEKIAFIKANEFILLGNNNLGGMVSRYHAFLLMNGYFYEQYDRPFITNGFDDSSKNYSKCRHGAKLCHARGILHEALEGDIYGDIYLLPTSNYKILTPYWRSSHYYRNDFSSDDEFVLVTTEMLDFFK
ncbi:hypothetical protein EDC55_11729 [Allofrancisella inopinata]|uniref:Uncharacterized protein n=1 Tax=Allofrancisella inopinata TaxID=1085647 RepID=A0AAE7CQJ8_9GAMM|nr:hypothetical protein [Allofrancisella inopinata]QIV95429.1 hypothetical protein E4K63_00680 [Allofrancisella inopinata]TDT69272.1 hypothetical protein EDC55_11729 [Allofrancisella inopinata]